MKRGSLGAWCNFLGAFIASLVSAAVLAQEPGHRDAAQLNLRRSVNTREYQGKEIEGAERVIARGDSLWRILVQEKGVPEKWFRSYLVIIHGLNPQLKNSDVLRIGESLFVPLRPDEVLASEAAAVKTTPASGKLAGSGVTVSYRVRAGEYLYQILRDQLGVSDNRKVAIYAALVKDLNPERPNWDMLQEGDVIRLPAIGQGQAAVTESKATGESKPATASNRLRESEPVAQAPLAQEPKSVAAPPAAVRDPHGLPARQNLTLLTKVVEALGSQVQNVGEEVMTVKETTLRLDKSSYPVIYSPKLHQRVVLDPDNKIPAALRASLSDPRVGAPVVTMTEQVSLHEAVSRLLAGLGYRALPADRPVVIQDEGIAFEAQGTWMILAPEENNKAQEIHIINLTEDHDEVPAYLKSQLARKGLHLQDVRLTSSTPKLSLASQAMVKQSASPLRAWPHDKSEVVDAVLLACRIPFGVAETLSVELADGLRLDARADRIFELSGRRIAVFFQPADPDIKKALQEKQGIESVELELAGLSSRDMVDKLLKVLGDQTVYKEQRFPAVEGYNKDKLMVTAWGFLIPRKSVFVTDREIPQGLHRFFFEKGLEIVYFR
jgi:hypothetical protein